MDLLHAISLWLGLVAYGIFLLFAVYGVLRDVTGKALLLAGTATLLWLLSLQLQLLPAISYGMQSLVVGCWLLLLSRALRVENERRSLRRNPLRLVSIGAIGLSVINGLALMGMGIWQLPAPTLGNSVVLLVTNISGLVLIEQLARNSRKDLHWRVRYLNIGLGLFFGYGTVLHGIDIAFTPQRLPLWVAQPAVAAVLVPFLIIASLRNRDQQLRFNLSREVAFRTGVLTVAGLFLLALSLLGYLAQLFAGDVGLTIATFFSVVGIGFLLTLLGSSRVRANIRVSLSKAFFAYRYDYRDEWLRLTRRLTEYNPDYDLPQQVQRAFLSVLQSHYSAIWLADERGFRFFSHFHSPQWQTDWPVHSQQALLDFLHKQAWVLDSKDSNKTTAKLIAELHQTFDGLAYVVPLLLNSDIYGVCLIGPSNLREEPLSWEDYDILKLQSRQATSFLALQQAIEENLEHEQFAAVNQMSAFLVHDIKTIAAQLSLMVNNAERHKDNPDFVDDMVRTTDNSVARMRKIIAGLSQQASADQPTRVDLAALVNEWLQATYNHQPNLHFNGRADVMVNTRPDPLLGAIGHITQNSLEAVDKQGQVNIVIRADEQHAYIDITDNGPGMSADFVANDLFKPFRSDKGVTGMGIGAYQAKEMIRQIDGDLRVDSTPGQGTTFTIRLKRAEGLPAQ